MIKENIKRKPGMMIYFDIFDNIVNSCSAQEIGNLIILAYQHQNGQDTSEMFQDDPKMKFIYGTLINSIDRDTEKYFNSCFRTSINKRFTDYKKARPQDDINRERWETENSVMVEEIREQYEQAKQYALGHGTIINTGFIDKLHEETFGTSEQFTASDGF